MGSGINNKIYEFLCNSKNVKKRNTRLEKCYGHVNIATAFLETFSSQDYAKNDTLRLQFFLNAYDCQLFGLCIKLILILASLVVEIEFQTKVFIANRTKANFDLKLEFNL